MAPEMLVYVGTYTRKEGEGIYLYRVDLAKGKLELVDVTPIISPSFLAIHPSGRYLYSVNEVGELEGKPSGGVSAFAIDPETGKLRFLNQQLSQGEGPCYVSVDKTGKFAFVANYVGGSVAVLPIREDGALEPASDFVQHEGKGADPNRQEKAHAHSILPDPQNRYILAADLGLDRVMVYKLDPQKGKLLPNETPWAQLAPGAGPRHIAFHPNGRYVYVINELDSTMTVFHYDAERGILQEVQTISALPEGFEGTSYCADVHVSLDGRFVYGSNRGHDSIVIFAVEKETGKLSCVGHEPTRGSFPRNFALSPDGELLLVANQKSDNIVAYTVNRETGLLSFTGEITEAPIPVCIKFYAL